MTCTVTIRYWAAARAAAGMDEETYENINDLNGLLVAIHERHRRADLDRVLGICSFLVDGVRGGELVEGAVVEALPPFAGG